MNDINAILQHDTGEPLSDTEMREAQQECLLAVIGRQTSCSLGRAAFALRTLCPTITQHVDVPFLCVRGRLSGPRGHECKLYTSDFALTNFNWPQFHNGVAAGLQVVGVPVDCVNNGGNGIVHTDRPSVDNAAQMDNTWILFNMPTINHGTQRPLSPSDAGFLFGLGLNGYLSRLNTFTIHEYLTKRDVFTGVAVLLGCAAGKLGTADHLVGAVLPGVPL